MNKFSIGFGIGVIGIILLYFFWFVPENTKAYDKGFKDAKGKIDTVKVEGETIVIHDTTVIKTEVERPILRDSSEFETNSSEFDSTFVSNKDIISVKAKVWFKDKAKWLVDIEHVDAREIQTDTLKIKVPQLIEVSEISWGWNLITFLGGVITAVLIFVIGN